MLKLTRYKPAGTVYVAPQHITDIESIDALTAVWIVGRSSPRFVTETPDQIMAMEQMVMLFNPAVVVNPDYVRRL